MNKDIFWCRSCLCMIMQSRSYRSWSYIQILSQHVLSDIYLPCSFTFTQITFILRTIAQIKHRRKYIMSLKLCSLESYYISGWFSQKNCNNLSDTEYPGTDQENAETLCFSWDPHMCLIILQRSKVALLSIN